MYNVYYTRSTIDMIYLPLAMDPPAVLSVHVAADPGDLLRLRGCWLVSTDGLLAE